MLAGLQTTAEAALLAEQSQTGQSLSTVAQQNKHVLYWGEFFLCCIAAATFIDYIRSYTQVDNQY